MSPPAVLYLHSSSGRYGADRQLHLIASGLERYTPIVVLPSRGELAADLEAAGVEVLVRPKLSVIRRALATPAGAVRIAAGAARDAVALGTLVRRRRIALVHSNTSVVLGGAGAAALARVPHVWHVREIYARFGRAWPPYRRVLGSASALVCVSEATAAQFTPGRARVIADGLAVDPSPMERGAARAALGIDPELPAVAVLGRISDWKGQDVLIRALAEPPLRERGTVALLAGEAWPGAEDRLGSVLALAGELGVRDRVALLGFRDDVAAVYGAADIVAVPSTEPDPLPGAAIEAAAAGCAVVASDHGGLPEIIHDRVTGRLVAPGDATALARVLGELFEDRAERGRLGSAAAADVRARFAPQRLLAGIQALYDELLSR